MEYTKHPITLTEQINILKQRGLIFENEDEAINVLSHISYFRLASYWRIMEEDSRVHRFRSGSRFSAVLELYNFDTELRSLVFNALQHIEIADKSGQRAYREAFFRTQSHPRQDNHRGACLKRHRDMEKQVHDNNERRHCRDHHDVARAHEGFVTFSHPEFFHLDSQTGAPPDSRIFHFLPINRWENFILLIKKFLDPGCFYASRLILLERFRQFNAAWNS